MVMFRHRLVPTLTVLLVLAAPSLSAAEMPAGTRPDAPLGWWDAALIELRELVAPWWPQPAAHGTVSAAGETGGPGGAGGQGGEGHGGYDPNGTQEDPEPTEGFQTPSGGTAG